MEDRCSACRAGPAGIEGHPALFVESMTPSRLTFRCSACHARWMRRYASASEFAWDRIEAGAPAGDFGVTVPRQ